MIGEYSRVKTLVAKEKCPKGITGVVVSIYSSGLACEFEIWEEADYPIDVITYLFEKLIEEDKY